MGDPDPGGARVRNPDLRLTPNRANVAAKVIDGEAIILDITRGAYYSMDGAGAVIWAGLDTGHSLGAIGSIELAACALALENQVVPPTANLHHPDPECDLDYVPLTAREHRMDVVLSVGSGFGGFQSAMVFSRLKEAA